MPILAQNVIFKLQNVWKLLCNERQFSFCVNDILWIYLCMEKYKHLLYSTSITVLCVSLFNIWRATTFRGISWDILEN